ncbi:hypothetical protein [uncultured Maritimibacter sp.]|jgi:hypothetical protein|uniref:hypothetical protein n=1 Tax=uncultured Maritimibacter sp. TaxID=991866 RepID=UPI0026278DD3|nr:hypothetical protein [uncultured Maritimibacter sp.]
MIRLCALLAFTATPAFAQGPTLTPPAAATVSDCNGETDLRHIAEPWDTATRAFPEGNTRVVLLNMTEPAEVPFKLLVLSPPVDDAGLRQCKVISGGEGWGFAAMDFAAHDAAFDPAAGMLFSLPVTVWQSSDDTARPATFSFSLNAETGEIATKLDLPGE